MRKSFEKAVHGVGNKQHHVQIYTKHAEYFDPWPSATETIEGQGHREGEEIGNLWMTEQAI